MADTLEPKPTEIVTEPKVDPKVDPKVEPVKEPTLEELKAKLAEAERHANNKTEEAERVHKKLEAFEKAEQAKKDAELSELDREKKARADLEVENKRLKTESLKQSIATKLGLPESLALRLQGETPEEIEKDAKEILETLPKKTAVNINATNPGAGAVVGETDDERGRRLGTRR